jgi:hypothetical protein
MAINAWVTMDDQFNEVRLTFTLDEQNRPSAFTLEGGTPEVVRFVVVDDLNK